MPSINSKKTKHRIVIGEWHYWPNSGKLKNKSGEQNLPTQLNLVLNLLIEKSQTVVTREEFLSTIWSGKYVNEDALSRTIAELRKILGDSASQSKYIKTIPKKGYQLTVEPIEFIAKRKSQWQKVIYVLLGISLLSALIWSMTARIENTLIQSVANAQRITSKPGMEQQSRISDNGLWLTYVTNTTKESFITFQSMTDINQLQKVGLLKHQLASPEYDPLTETLWFLARDENRCYLMSKNLKNNKVQEWADCVFGIESRTMTANFKNNALYFSNYNQNKQVAIHQLNTISGQITSISQPIDNGEQDKSPNISPNKQWLSFSRGTQTVRNLWLKNLKTGEEKAITFGEHYSVSHDWFDDQHIVFDSDMSGSRQLWLLNINNFTISSIGGYGAQHPSFDDNAEVMTFQKVNYEANIWQLDIKSNNFSRLVNSTKYDNNPAFSPDGKSFAFTSNRQDTGSIWFYDFEQNQERLLLVLPNGKLTRPSWSKDGKTLLVTVNDKDGYKTLSYNIDENNYQEIPFTVGNLSAIEHDGKIFSLSKSKTNSHQILTLENGHQEILPLKNISRFMFLSDGRLVFSKVNQVGLFIIDSNFQQENVLVNDLPINAFNSWTVSGLSVFYDYSGEDAGIYRINANTLKKEKITSYRPYSVGTSLSVNSEQSAILITRTDRAESDVFKATIE